MGVQAHFRRRNLFARVPPDGTTYHWLFATTMAEVEVVTGAGGQLSDFWLMGRWQRDKNKFFAGLLALRFILASATAQTGYLHILVQLGNGFVSPDQKGGVSKVGRLILRSIEQ